MIKALPLDDKQRALLAQILRYAVTGGIVTLLGVATYALFVRVVAVPPLVANVAAYLVSMALGYFLHGRFSFRDQATAGGSVRVGGKFFVTSGISFALNSFFVWLFTSVLHWDRLTPIAAMVFITPAICFVIYRKWVFA
ncbi:GtrA family protein [Sphingomonas sp.]|uniref:GtrA family protein n=1 Tax=Sphingomonas sp. TaxID=28214 RepID=UPI0025D817E1|nr:GtrA family protein [Sphingomonas sp.]